MAESYELDFITPGKSNRSNGMYILSIKNINNDNKTTQDRTKQN